MYQPKEWGEFVRAFNGIAKQHHRYEVFRDFVTVSAIALHNALHQVESLETEYLSIVGRYSREEADELTRLFARLVVLLESEPRDVLGQLYMELDLGNANTGQFFTPPEMSELLARLSYSEKWQTPTPAFVTLSDPACGGGGMVLAFVKVMLSHGHNPARHVWVQAQDIDRTAALMCFVQMALWNVPGVVIVGNTLTAEVREAFYTPAHYLECWPARLRHREQQRIAGATVENDAPEAVQVLPDLSKANMPRGANGTSEQFGFDF